MNIDQKEALVVRATEARKASYCPYSGFSVGAALLTADGKIYTGANIESASYSPTVCAERVSFFGAIHDGARNFCAIAVVGGEADKEVSSFCSPCGVCRQVMSEFCNDDFLVILSNGTETIEIPLRDLLPARFDLKDVQNGGKV